ncbi:hypothetical protein L5F42_02750 [Aliarcobacter butzleri]|uniref:hypothetical protein n=1 Tax=Aliarcobacter butzleri TaxID=28197 RepID=UPI001EDFC8ED|nr:hypothetical protein [Aliarcobacter butzleri]MCG3698754.1 hypothetical protein [Aliarcobacter butzleri]
MIGFYISKLKNLFDVQTIIYCYQAEPFEAIELESGDCSSLWNLKEFVFCEKQEELFLKYKDIIDD